MEFPFFVGFWRVSMLEKNIRVLLSGRESFWFFWKRIKANLSGFMFFFEVWITAKVKNCLDFSNKAEIKVNLKTFVKNKCCFIEVAQLFFVFWEKMQKKLKKTLRGYFLFLKKKVLFCPCKTETSCFILYNFCCCFLYWSLATCQSDKNILFPFFVYLFTLSF